MKRTPRALVRARLPGRPGRSWLAFGEPAETCVARRPAEVRPLLERVERATQDGRWAVGFLSYESAGAFDSALVTRPPGPLPLAWFTLFSRVTERAELPPVSAPSPALAWRPALSLPGYRRAIDRIHQLIAAGDTYQVNFTWRLDAPFAGNPWALFHRLVARSPTDHAAYLDTGRHVIASASPELFFRFTSDKVGECSRLTCRPMKGTVARGRWPAEDRLRALALFDSPKDRAENLMIVDMIRNDLGRIARAGSVRVESLFDLERHATVFQLTSTVSAETTASVSEVVAALFPCASVTGAPKVRTMQIIAELERRPRGIYTGAIGYLAPGGHAEMSVAIRTLWLDREQGHAQYGTGGGIVWDSLAEDEYRECLSKTLVLRSEGHDFELLETLLWTAASGYRLLDRHLARLSSSADHFGFRFDRKATTDELERLAEALSRSGESSRVVRLLARRDGRLRFASRALQPSEKPWHLALARRPVDPESPFLFHKTTRRELYDQARAEAPGFDDVLLWNPEREATESAWANVAVKRSGVWLTPPIEAGLLPGCERQELLAAGELSEAPIPLAELGGAEEIVLLNSVRGRIAVEQIEDPATGRVLWTAAGESPNRTRERNPRDSAT